MRSRVGVSYRILPLSREECGEYIVHRLSCAGRDKPIFTEDAIDVIHSTTRGVPREINNLCDLCLLIGSGEDVDIVKPSLVEKAIEEMTGVKNAVDGGS
jgi:general secretion pathway protein A